MERLYDLKNLFNIYIYHCILINLVLFNDTLNTFLSTVILTQEIKATWTVLRVDKVKVWKDYDFYNTEYYSFFILYLITHSIHFYEQLFWHRI